MPEELTSNNKSEHHKLTTKNYKIFKILLEKKLYNNYDFTTLKNKSNMKTFQDFLNKLIGKSISWKNIEDLYKRKNDKNDKHNGEQIIHFGEKDKSFRLHGVRRGEYFVLLRIDPNHDFNNKKK